jgi:hypothetical protein
MTDERLLARLRGHGNKDTIAAADRIEALTKERDEAMQLLQTLSNMNGDLSRDMYKTKLLLAKAVEALEVIRDRKYHRMGPGITAQVIARATLAEIEGDTP